MTYDPNRQSGKYNATERQIEQSSDQAHEAIDATRSQAHELADQARERTQQVAAKAEEGRQVAGEKLSAAAQALREHAPASGQGAQVAEKAADTLERAGSYLQEQDLREIRHDLEDLIRRHPLEAVLLGVGVGYLLARNTRR